MHVASSRNCPQCISLTLAQWMHMQCAASDRSQASDALGAELHAQQCSHLPARMDCLRYTTAVATTAPSPRPLFDDISRWCASLVTLDALMLAQHEMASPVDQSPNLHDDEQRAIRRRHRTRSMVDAVYAETLATIYTSEFATLVLEQLTDLMILHHWTDVDLGDTLHRYRAALATIGVGTTLFDFLHQMCAFDKKRCVDVDVLADDNDWTDWFESM